VDVALNVVLDKCAIWDLALECVSKDIKTVSTMDSVRRLLITMITTVESVEESVLLILLVSLENVSVKMNIKIVIDTNTTDVKSTS